MEHGDVFARRILEKDGLEPDVPGPDAVRPVRERLGDELPGITQESILAVTAVNVNQ